MSNAAIDFSALYAAGLPAPAPHWNGFPRYNFVGGHNDAARVPVDALVKSASAVLATKAQRSRTMACRAVPSAIARCVNS